MINNPCTDQLDDAIDYFEEDWSPDSRGEIRSLLRHFDLAGDYAALTELIRIDIELRYRQGLSIQLDEYFDEFQDLLSQPQHVAQIAFEDYRSRAAYGHPVSLARWRELPGVREEVWYQDLTRESRASGASRLRHGGARQPIADAAFESALQKVGFRLVDELGRGALSHVYLAKQHDLADRYVVLKVVKKPLAEPENMAMLQHTNIVPIYSYHRIESRSVICMPYAGGVTLADFLSAEQRAASEPQGTANRGRSSLRGGQSLMATVLNRVHDTVIDSPEDANLPPTDAAALPAADDNAVLKPLEQLRAMDCNQLALWIFPRLAAALAHSHARGVLHGDLKPANVLIRNDGEPALLDFNLAQSLDRGQIQHFGGTLPYMAPESYRALMGQAVTPHSSSDIYGLGVMLFEFVTGRLPHAAPRTSAEVDLEPAIRWRRDAPDWRADDPVSPGLRAIVNRCLAFAPADRYQSAEQLQEDLDRQRQDLPLAFANEPWRFRVKKWIRRHPRLVSGSSVAMLLIGLLIPAAVSAKFWRDQSLHAAVTANMKAFADESSAALAIMMANPTRHEETSIVAAMQPLQDFGVLQASRAGEFESPQISSQHSAAHRDTAMRHVAQVAFAEIDRLRASEAKRLHGSETVDGQARRPGQGKDEAAADPQRLQRLNQLVQALQRIQGDRESRACLFIRSEQARLAGDPETSRSLSQRAESLTWQDDDTESYLEAIRLFTLRDYPQARDILTTLADRGTIPTALRWTTLGRSQYHQGQYEDAKLSFTQSIERAPHASRLWKLRGLCYYKTREYARAAEDFSQAIKLEPTLYSAWSDRGLCKEAMRDLSGALDDYNAVLQRHPENVHALILRSRAQRKAGKDEAADRDFRAALTVENPSPAAIVIRAHERFQQGDFAGALADFEQALQQDRGNSMLLQNVAMVLSKQKRYPEAISRLGEAIEVAPWKEKAVINRALLLARIGRYEEARQDLRRAIRPPNDPEVLYQAGCVNALFPGEQTTPIALAFLSKAIQAGFDADLKNDKDLDAIRETKGFQSLVETIELGHRLRRKKSSPTAIPQPNGPPDLDE